MGGTIINLGASEAQKAELLPSIASGETLLGLALEESHKHNPYLISTQASAKGDMFEISGEKTFVLDGHIANKLIVVARTSGEQNSRSGISLFLVDRESQGVSISRTIMADSRNAANVSFKGVEVPSSAVIGQLDKCAADLDEALDNPRQRL